MDGRAAGCVSAGGIVSKHPGDSGRCVLGERCQLFLSCHKSALREVETVFTFLARFFTTFATEYRPPSLARLLSRRTGGYYFGRRKARIGRRRADSAVKGGQGHTTVLQGARHELLEGTLDVGRFVLQYVVRDDGLDAQSRAHLTNDVQRGKTCSDPRRPEASHLLSARRFQARRGTCRGVGGATKPRPHAVPLASGTAYPDSIC